MLFMFNDRLTFKPGISSALDKEMGGYTVLGVDMNKGPGPVDSLTIFLARPTEEKAKAVTITALEEWQRDDADGASLIYSVKWVEEQEV